MTFFWSDSTQLWTRQVRHPVCLHDYGLLSTSRSSFFQPSYSFVTQAPCRRCWWTSPNYCCFLLCPLRSQARYPYALFLSTPCSWQGCSLSDCPVFQLVKGNRYFGSIETRDHSAHLAFQSCQWSSRQTLLCCFDGSNSSKRTPLRKAQGIWEWKLRQRLASLDFQRPLGTRGHPRNISVVSRLHS